MVYEVRSNSQRQSDIGICFALSVVLIKMGVNIKKKNIPPNNELINYFKKFTRCLKSRCRRDQLQKMI